MKNVLILVLMLATLTAFAQTTERTGIERKGFVIGFNVGGGVITVSDNGQDGFSKAHGGFSFPDLKLGGMINHRLAILATTSGMIYDYNKADRTFGTLIPVAQFWGTNRWWINGGIGMAMDYPALYDFNENGNNDLKVGCAVTFGTGYEVLQKEKFAIDLQAKITMGRAYENKNTYRDGVACSIGVGFNWF